jgi:23S rRNA (uracil1939-C5)-methyltransferase
LAGFPTALEEDYGVGEITLAAAGFAQANPLMTRKLLADLLAALPLERSLLELYGGSGTFSLALAARCRRLEVWESEAAALERNRRNLSRHGFGDVKLVRARVGAVRLPRDCEIVVLDPPRTGLPAGVVGELKASRAREIFYISCNPATLARDLSRLQAATAAVPGFSLQTLRAYDMYPGTPPLELLAHLVR